jgi:hypothetical protein
MKKDAKAVVLYAKINLLFIYMFIQHIASLFVLDLSIDLLEA